MSAGPRLSLAEVAATTAKAALGCGWPPGLADDLADAARAWASASHDPLAMALAALEAPAGGELEISGGAGVWHLAPAPILHAGPTALDLAEAAPAPTRVRLEAVDAPEALLALTLARAARRGGLWRVSSGAEAASHIGAGAARLGAIPPPGSPMAVERRGDAPPLRLPKPHEGLDLDQGLWPALTRLAARTLVPATDASRRGGAGAGLTDSD